MALDKVTTGLIADDAVSTDQIANNASISTSGAITTTGAFTSIGIDDNANALAMTIDSSENIGVGCTPDAWEASMTAIDIGQQGSIAGQTSGDLVVLTQNAYTDGTWKYKNTDEAAQLEINDGVYYFKVASSGTADNAISWTTGMTIANDGDVGFGTTSLLSSQVTIKSEMSWDGSTANSAPLRVLSANNTGNGAIAVGGNDNCGIYNHSGTGLGIQSRSDMNFYCQDVNDDRFHTKTRRMTIANNGNIGVPGNSTAIYNASDKRLKENINDLSGCLAKVKQLKGVSFNWIEGFADDSQGRTEYGFIAQDVQDIDTNLIYDFSLVPVEVTTLYKEGDDIPNDKEIGDIKTETIVDNPLRVNEKFIVPMLLEAVKELSAKVTALENA